MHIHTERGGFKHVIGNTTLHLTWDSGVTVQHKNELYKSVEKGLTHQMDTNRNTLSALSAFDTS